MLDDETKREETVAAVLDQLRQQLGPNLPREMVARVRAHGGEPIATEDAPLTELEGIPVIAADDVGAYVNALEKGCDFSALATPPHRYLLENGAASRLTTWSPCGHPGRIAPNRGHGDHGHHHGHHIPDL